MEEIKKRICALNLIICALEIVICTLDWIICACKLVNPAVHSIICRLDLIICVNAWLNSCYALNSQLFLGRDFFFKALSFSLSPPKQSNKAINGKKKKEKRYSCCIVNYTASSHRTQSEHQAFFHIPAPGQKPQFVWLQLLETCTHRAPSKITKHLRVASK